MKMKVKLEGKICGVCGDKALGCNFNAITCESCKAFFRRNALLQKDFKCPFSEHCDITPITRRFCQKCRLDKCFSIGMCKNLIMTEEDKELKRKKIIENKNKKLKGISAFKKGFKKIKRDTNLSKSKDTNAIINNDNSEEEQVSYSTSDITIIPPYENREDERSVLAEEFTIISSQDTQIVSSSDDVPVIRSILNNTPQNQFFNQSGRENDNEVEYHFKTFTHIDDNENEVNNQENITSSVNNVFETTEDVMDNNRSTSVELNSLESILSEAIKLEFQAFSSINQNNSKELNDAERAKLNELIVASKVLVVPLDEELKNSLLGEIRDPQSKLEADPALLDVINLTAIAIRRLIKMAKKINAFKNMCQEDQVALLKGGSTEIMILRSAVNYNSKNKSWQIPQKQQSINLNVDVLKLAKNNAYEEHEKFIKTFDPRWRSDENIILIMCAITLFTPDRPKVVHKDVIKLEQNSYYYLLRRYLECTYPGCEAKSTFLKLMKKISDLHILNEELVNVYLDVNPSLVEPLLIELFDLKH